MKNLAAILLVLISIVSCNSQKVYSDFDYSYSKSGGKEMIYENLLIKDNNVHYSFEGNGEKVKENFKISNEDIDLINKVLKENNFRKITEDHKKLYDKTTITINIKKGDNSGNKSDASLILPQYKKNWEAIVSTFQDIINKNIKK